MGMFWFWIGLLLLAFAIAALPGWRHTRNRWPYSLGGRYRFYPSAGAALGVALILLLFLLGLIAMDWPGATAPAVE
ncbi:hypothetical protein OEW28_09460 [Defluviimonas sp. WL0002]|uniref:DUF2905 domain-containing protein n=1 Tax=Albidovulum marisflavi TaxID=2984159 RepID=A0ABT2ZCL4_9RHOB|nr:hypothetical protein [Defluviimonas sp. WL0002]MCV2868854.1 hypothetical protein [Defluviimonas sp. WL0002]